MASRRLQDFLSTYCNLDEDPTETLRVMHGQLGAQTRPWLLPELDAAIAAHSISPALATRLTSLHFDSSADVADWLRDLRTSWFGDD
ncbi:hypothetical protein FHX75_1597 [Micromonospora palomenae]|uniref:CdiI immunity protein domain-containing protein n=1 Tax=Micromonospora palomenae TaxID=1461247 RepID=A0A561VHB9_9ACTN|nr:hypothetical protein [Micromonospora palomenae]TWG11009.1 hypothetical protein FHX75_1597 [Micromonospora palomenae]